MSSERDDAPRSPWSGVDLGSRTVAYTHTDVILYALSVGARADEYDLVDEARLRTIPTFALVLGQWASDELGSRGAFDTTRALHGAQSLEMYGELPPSGELELRATVAEVWDKGKAAIFEVEVGCDLFVARWSIYAPGAGGFDGARGSSEPPVVLEGSDSVTTRLVTRPDQAALYRLNGDRHRIHIDPEAARGIGQPAPILHGLCTLASAALEISRVYGLDPWQIVGVNARFGAPVFPGDVLELRSRRAAERVDFQVGAQQPFVLGGGVVTFGDPADRRAS